MRGGRAGQEGVNAWMRRWWMCLAAVVVLLAGSGEGLVISQSKVQTCTDEGDGPEDCDEKIVVLLSVPSEKDAGTSRLEAVLDKVEDDTGSTVDEREFEEPLQIVVTRSPAKAAYRLQYETTLNAKPEEVVAQVKDCVDQRSEQATCSVYKDGEGNIIPGSEGFCCECDLDDSIDDTFGSDGRRAARYEIDCGIFENKFFVHGNPATAHCLRLAQNDWFDVYNVQDPRFEFGINITLKGLDNGPDLLSVSPAEPAKRTNNSKVLAELLGDFQGYAVPPSLGGRFYIVPRKDSSRPMEESTMVVPRDMVSLSGRECDRIGTGFLAFQGQQARCMRPVGTCLKNRGRDVLNDDQDTFDAGKTPEYLLARWAPNNEVETDPGTFKLPVEGQKNSALRLELDATKMRFVQHLADGEFLNATLVNSNGGPAESFEALSGDGYIWMKINNTGGIPADFIPSLNCTEGVQMIQSKGRVAIVPGKPEEITVRVAVSDQKEKERECLAVLRDARLKIVDTKVVEFSTNATDFDDINLDLEDDVANSDAVKKADISCSAVCPNPANIFCSMSNNCWERAMFSLLVLCAIFGVAYCVCTRCGCCRSSQNFGGSQPVPTASPKPVVISERESKPDRENVNAKAKASPQAAAGSPSSSPQSALGSSPSRPWSRIFGASSPTARRQLFTAQSSSSPSPPPSDRQAAPTRPRRNDSAESTSNRNDSDQSTPSKRKEPAYLVVSGLSEGKGGLVAMGPSAVLAGFAQRESDGSAKFYLAPGRSRQVYAHNARTGHYTHLLHPRQLDPSELSPRLEAGVAGKALLETPNGATVLN